MRSDLSTRVRSFVPRNHMVTIAKEPQSTPHECAR